MDDTYLVDSYGYMVRLPGISEEEEIISASAMAERALSAAELAESIIANFKVGDQTVRRQGARISFSSMELSCRIQRYMWACQSHGSIPNICSVPSKGKSRGCMHGEHGFTAELEK